MATITDKKVFNNVLEAIGDTPMIRINRITKGIKASVFAKIETVNPGNSIKDRMAVRMIEDAERAGLLKPGGTIIEGTSGNTGMGLAIAAVVKGYRCVFTTTDKQSKEKIDALRAFGAEVIVCPTNVDPEDPRSYYSVSSRLEQEIPNSWKANQYDNLSNSAAHYEETGPEIWEQTDGRVTHLVVGVGTGGTISGVGRYLKERNPRIKVWGIDTYGSVFKKYKETGIFDKNEIYPYVTEGIGEDFLPKNVDFSVIDHFEKVTDKDAALMTRRIAREEGIFAGNSAGSAMAGLLQLRDRFTADDLVVVIFHDHGSRYLGKMFNDDWMREKGFFDKSGLTARDLVASGVSGELLAIEGTEPVEVAVKLMGEHDFSQISITRDKRLVGSLNEAHLYDQLVRSPEVKTQPVETIMQPAFPFVDVSTPLELLSTMITPGQSGGPREGLQDRQDLHHHAFRRHPRALLGRRVQWRNRLLSRWKCAYNQPGYEKHSFASCSASSCSPGPAYAQGPDASGTWDMNFNTPNGPIAAVLTSEEGRREAQRDDCRPTGGGSAPGLAERQGHRHQLLGADVERTVCHRHERRPGRVTRSQGRWTSAARDRLIGRESAEGGCSSDGRRGRDDGGGGAQRRPRTSPRTFQGPGSCNSISAANGGDARP